MDKIALSLNVPVNVSISNSNFTVFWNEVRVKLLSGIDLPIIFWSWTASVKQPRETQWSNAKSRHPFLLATDLTISYSYGANLWSSKNAKIYEKMLRVVSTSTKMGRPANIENTTACQFTKHFFTVSRITAAKGVPSLPIGSAMKLYASATGHSQKV